MHTLRRLIGPDGKTTRIFGPKDKIQLCLRAFGKCIPDMPKRKLLPVGYMIPVPDMITKLRQVFKNIRAVRPDLVFHGIRIVPVMVQYDLGKQADSGRALLFFPLGI